jgi:hypothetical protein
MKLAPINNPHSKIG